MDSYPAPLISIPAPLVLIQGLNPDNLPIDNKRKDIRKSRILESQKFNNDKFQISNYGLDIKIERELELIDSDKLKNLILLINNFNFRHKILSNENESFNFKFVPKKAEILINGSKSKLSPYNCESNNKYYGNFLPFEWINKYYSYLPTVFISIYELNDNENFDDLLINEINRIDNQLNKTNTKYICIIIINSNNGSINNERINRLNLKIANKLLFYYNLKFNSSENIKFIKHLILTLRKESNIFFNLQIEKLKKRELKNLDYSKKLFTTRNLIKLTIFEQFKSINEYSLNLLEYSYDQLLKIYKNFQNNDSIQLEILNWLDILCFNIIRSCILINFKNFNMAYRKFYFHLKIINKLNNNRITFNWLSIQYTWISELMICYQSLNEGNNKFNIYDLIMNNSFNDNNGGNNSKKPIKFNSFNMPHIGILFLQAFKYREMSLKYEINENEVNNDNRILLLTGSLDSFFNCKNVKFSRFESKIYNLLGDIYYELGNFSMSINNYSASLTIYKREKWDKINEFIIKKMVNCYIKLFKFDESFKKYIELCLISKDAKYLKKIKNELDILQIENDSEEIDNSNQYLSIKDEMFKSEVLVHDYFNNINEFIKFQIVLYNKIKYIEILEIKEIDILIEKESGNGKDSGKSEKYQTIKLLNDENVSNLNNKFKIDSEAGDEIKINCNLTNFKNKLVFQIETLIKNIGKFSISKINIKGNLNDIFFENLINVNNAKDYNENSGNDKYVMFIGEGLIENKNKFPTNYFEILPKIPKIDINLKYDSIGFNEQEFPILINLNNLDDEFNIRIKIKGECRMNEQEIEMKFEEPKAGEDVIKCGNKLELKCLLKIPKIKGGLPIQLPEENNCKFKIIINYEVINEDNLKIEKVKEGEFKLIELIDWFTELRVEEFDKSKIFFNSKEEEKLKIPKHVRRWKFNLNIKNLSFDKIDIISCNFLIKGPKGILMNLESQDEGGNYLDIGKDKELVVYLNIQCIERLIRTVPISLECLLKYRIDKLANEQEYHLIMYKANLPQIDPRVLVVLEKTENEDNMREVSIKYVIENPTDGIFQYQTNQSVGSDCVKIVDYTKSTLVNVMPYSYKEIRVRYLVDTKGAKQRQELPEFTIFDRQFQMFVKVNVASDGLQMVEGRLYLV